MWGSITRSLRKNKSTIATVVSLVGAKHTHGPLLLSAYTLHPAFLMPQAHWSHACTIAVVPHVALAPSTNKPHANTYRSVMARLCFGCTVWVRVCASEAALSNTHRAPQETPATIPEAKPGEEIPGVPATYPGFVPFIENFEQVRDTLGATGIKGHTHYCM